jgi:hypothetical protein
MPLQFEASTVHFQDECMVEEALSLVEFLRTREGVRIDMKDCAYIHTAVLQVLAAAAPREIVLPESSETGRWVSAVLGAR